MAYTASLRLKRIVWVTLSVTAGVGTLLLLAAENIGVPPRALAAYIERRASGHAGLIEDAGHWAGGWLAALDRGDDPLSSPSPLRIGAQPEAASAPTGGTVVLVDSTDQAARAIGQAHPGDVITFLPGSYRFSGSHIEASRAGTESNRIMVRAEHAGTVVLYFDMAEGFVVSAPYWTFENLTVRGACGDHADCEHAFHVVAEAAHFVARNNTIVDFNAHFKINSEGGHDPDHGLIEGNTLTNTAIRQTTSAVVPIDLVAASHWTIRGNLISDFVKGLSSRTGYGAFAKGGGSDNRFERNIVRCEHLLRGAPGQRVGLSLGGGGTAKEYCRDQQCITEQDRSSIVSNLIVSCSDDGIDVNRAAASRIAHNTLIDTGGILVRSVESSADVQGNLVDGTIRRRDGGVLHDSDNYETSMTRLYLGVHPVRRLFANAGALDLTWSGAPPRRPATEAAPSDLCGAQRPLPATYGAFEDFTACRRARFGQQGP